MLSDCLWFENGSQSIEWETLLNLKNCFDTSYVSYTSAEYPNWTFSTLSRVTPSKKLSAFATPFDLFTTEWIEMFHESNGWKCSRLRDFESLCSDISSSEMFFGKLFNGFSLVGLLLYWPMKRLRPNCK